MRAAASYTRPGRALYSCSVPDPVLRTYIFLDRTAVPCTYPHSRMHGTVAHYHSMAKAVQCCTGVERLQYTLRRKSKCLEWHSALTQQGHFTHGHASGAAAHRSVSVGRSLFSKCFGTRVLARTPVPSKTVIAASRAFNRAIAALVAASSRRASAATTLCA